MKKHPFYWMLYIYPGDSTENRTRVTAVKGRCLDRLTMEPQTGCYAQPDLTKLATTYFPRQSPAKYHRRLGA